jgi:L-asparagine transporter-like permease
MLILHILFMFILYVLNLLLLLRVRELKFGLIIQTSVIQIFGIWFSVMFAQKRLKKLGDDVDDDDENNNNNNM